MNEHLSLDVQAGLMWFYVLLAAMNAVFALAMLRAKKFPGAVLWAAVTGLALMHALAYFLHGNVILPKSIRENIDALMNPVLYTTLSVVAFALMLFFRKYVARPQVGWAILNIVLFAGGWAMTDSNFQAIVAKPDNVPISMLIFSVGFFTWLGLHRAVRNDERMDRGEPALEKLDDEKVLVWPDLVYTELICMVICTFVLIVWAIVLKAPLEPPATTSKAPNPSKAPWYFLGLQEMLVYFDPWMAGVVLPTFIIIGLMALPYIDFNREGNGFYTFKRRAFAITTFMFGFIVLWVTLIVLGTFLRGPNWNFFGPFSPWDPHKVLPLNNVNVSELFWLRMLHQPLEGMNPGLRELPGLVLVFAYLFLIPPLLARTVFRKFFIKMGFARFMVLVVLLLFMAALPIKMVLRWTLNLKYVVSFPEAFFNI
ncbi:MAG TPA: hypothetical protein VMS17_13540 [Gemmataceae bacterium]|nr:hypothetical protein [Gemmataceae bacterium]